MWIFYIPPDQYLAILLVWRYTSSSNRIRFFYHFFFFFYYLFLSILCVLFVQVSLRISGFFFWFLNFSFVFSSLPLCLANFRVNFSTRSSSQVLPSQFYTSAAHLLIFFSYISTPFHTWDFQLSLVIWMQIPLSSFCIRYAHLITLVLRTCVGWVCWLWFSRLTFLSVGSVLAWDWSLYLWFSICLCESWNILLIVPHDKPKVDVLPAGMSSS